MACIHFDILVLLESDDGAPTDFIESKWLCVFDSLELFELCEGLCSGPVERLPELLPWFVDTVGLACWKLKHQEIRA